MSRFLHGIAHIIVSSFCYPCKGMEGPSLVIATEELAPYVGQKVLSVGGKDWRSFLAIKNQKLRTVQSWGKHLILNFENVTLRIHFLMFGSYSVNKPRPNRKAKLVLTFPSGEKIYFYSCAIKEIDKELDKLYDWSVDIMSKCWNSRKALAKVRELPNEMVCDVLMDQNIFAGVGNIIKNEVLYRLHIHPETRIGQIPMAEQSALVHEAHLYSRQFYEWKKKNQLKRHWLIFRKKTCPLGQPVIKRATGKGQRISYYCENCQIPRKPKLRLVIEERDLSF
jgi:endonuclease VIII